MNVKRYIVKDVNEAMIKIKNELGRDAVILNTRKIKSPGFFGLFKRSLIEVVAAIDEEQITTKTPDLSENEIQQLRDELKKVVEERHAAQVVEQEKVETAVPEKKEIEELKEMVMALSDKVNNQVVAAPLPNTHPSHPAGASEDRLEALLKNKDLSAESINRIRQILKGRLNMDESNDQSILNTVRLIVKEILDEPYTIDEGINDKKVILFVGPTGVGKTTTLAKLAARLSLINNKTVGLITADTYRIAAVDQLKTYSEILGLPLKVIYEPEEIKDALNRYKDKDCILIDTAGRSHKSEELLHDLKGILTYVENPEIFLVISMTTGYKDIKSIIDSYKFLDDYKLLLTKLDETSSFGNVLNIKLETGKSLSYFTIGQSVPDDIEVANTDKIANYIVGE
ncbi:MAG: flagellar biosynthesis protein FlhF [Clostridia bacterium]|nr:flagellar biosynthesis protein FlhF [Clostridia bacterium]